MTFNATEQESYRQLRSIVAERTRPVVSWVGSGVSADVGLPTWPSLRGDLVEALRTKVATLEDSTERSLLVGRQQSVAHVEDPWVAFQILKEALGTTSFQEVIRTTLGSYDKAEIPEVYRLLWRIGVRGAISLNLDRLLTRALGVEHPGSAPNEFFGRDVARATPTISSPHRYVLSPHGRVEDAASWVLTKRDITQLLADEAYRSVIRIVAGASTLLFVGISIDDEGVRPHLEALKVIGLDVGPHFWFTSRRDVTSDRLAEGLGVRIVRYEARGRDHSALRLLLQDILNFVPTEPQAEPVATTHDYQPQTDLAPPEDLARIDAELMRRKLNAHAKGLLESGDGAYERYDEFCREYEEAIYRSWFISSDPTRTELLGHRLEKAVASGAFGRVFKAQSTAGEEVAIKLLHQDVHRNAEMLQSFRRGVRAMRILAKNGVPGMVRFRDASEIPAVVVMEWIEGPNLHEAVEARQITTWEQVIRIGEALGRIVLSAHALPERVLHRDIRPRNVLLRNFWDNPERAEVMLTDFDLSWHLGAREASILQGTTNVGYLAPEQIQRMQRVSTRNAAVDSYGLGMTLFFLISRRDPTPLEHRNVGWDKSVIERAMHFASCSWMSLPRRFARLILRCTQEVQHQRWDISQVVSELRRLRLALSGNDAKAAPELLAEELLARALDDREYEWDDDHVEAHFDTGRGLTTRSRVADAEREVAFDVSWISEGDRDRRLLQKWAPRARQEIEAILRRGAWRTDLSGSERGELRVSASKRVEDVRSCFDDDARRLGDVIGKAQPPS